jgi:adenylate cyclase
MIDRAQSNNTAHTPDTREIRAQLERITESADFDTSQRSADFLQYVVNETLADRAGAISQHAIACQVFGRGDDFDATIDPIVRMQAGRVRRSLEHYYLTAGAEDPVLVGLPKGSYVPAFEFSEASPPEPQPRPTPTSADDDSWPTLLLSPLHNLTGKQAVEFIAQGLVSDLAAEFSQDKVIQVFLSPSMEEGAKLACPARFELGGTVALRGDDLKINLHLIDGATGRQTWANTYFCPEGPDQGALLDQVVQTTVAMVAEEHGILSSHLGEEARQRPLADSKGYEAILRHHHFDATHEPQAFHDALAALLQAVESDTDCALCWSFLARLGGVHWSLGLPGDVIPIEDSMTAARRGAEIAPMDVRCRVVLAFVLLIADETDQARAEANTALELSGRSAFWLDTIGYLLTLSGDWEKGPEVIRKAVRINPFPRRSCYSALWLDALRRDDRTDSIKMAAEYAPEVHFWDPLMQAVTLVEDDRVDEAGPQVERLLELKPDFADRGHWLITRYVKFPPLVQRIEKALAMAGLDQLDEGGSTTEADGHPFAAR